MRTLYAANDLVDTAAKFATLVGSITDGLDVVVLSHGPSKPNLEYTRIRLSGNPVDLEVAVKRASEFGVLGE